MPNGNNFVHEGSLAELIEWFTRHLTSSYVYTLSFQYLSSADLAALPLVGFSTVHADTIALGICDLLDIADDDFTNFLLCFPPFIQLDVYANKLRSTLICDNFLRKCRHHGVSQFYIVLLEPPVGGYFHVSIDEVLNFCGAPLDDTREAGRIFHVDYVADASQIADAVIKNVKSLCRSGLDVALFPSDLTELPPTLQLGPDLTLRGISVELVEERKKSPGCGQLYWEESKMMRSIKITVVPE
ncbi:hypothetical protein AAVH_11796 [Aphelenchoides avenae]|nr:hypothetical protein AAVH_11796 [Aphelenchus avenae]